MTLTLKQICVAAAAAFALTVAASAQSAAKPTPPAVQPQSRVATARETGTGMATGKREAASGQASGQNAKNSAHATEVLEYKDGEDATTHTRPVNNKPAAEGTTTPAASADQAKATPKKQVAGVKYEDRQASLPACDGASKDSAKCAAPTTAAPSGTRVNKVDSITIKQ